MKINIHNSWESHLRKQLDPKKINQLMVKISEEYNNYNIFPPKSCVFSALQICGLNDIKVVIIGQDPYYRQGQANGLAFSVNDGVDPPASLRNILKEVDSDIGTKPKSPNLINWAKQGVLLLNCCLTVRECQPASHSNIGWDFFTNEIINTLSNESDRIIFLLWGKFAQQKSLLIDQKKHVILTAAHPSPLSASKGFFGCKHFSKTNEILLKINKKPIDW